jgi:hypothetical protein
MVQLIFEPMTHGSDLQKNIYGLSGHGTWLLS